MRDVSLIYAHFYLSMFRFLLFSVIFAAFALQNVYVTVTGINALEMAAINHGVVGFTCVTPIALFSATHTLCQNFFFFLIFNKLIVFMYPI